MPVAVPITFGDMGSLGSKLSGSLSLSINRSVHLVGQDIDNDDADDNDDDNDNDKNQNSVRTRSQAHIFLE